MVVMGQKTVPEQHSVILFNSLPCASELIVGYVLLSEMAPWMFLTIYIKVEHYKG